jgi:tetratricopeptide (TPR) repeat protein
MRSLMRKSFLTRDQGPGGTSGAGGRYQIHELLRQYGEEKLRQRPEAWKEARDQHAAYYANYLAEGQQSFRKLGPGAERLEADNLCAAWGWILERRKVAECRRAMGGLFWFDEGRAWSRTRGRLLERAIALLRHAEPVRENQIALGVALGYLAVSPPYDPRPAAAREGHQILIELDARRELAEAKIYLYVSGVPKDHTQAQRLLQESISLARETDFPSAECWALHHLGGLYCARAMGHGLAEAGIWQRAQDAFARALDLHRRTGHRRGEAILLQAQAACAHAQGQYAKARSLYKESLVLCRELGIREWELYCLQGLADLALATDDYQEAQSCYLEGLDKAQAWGNPFQARHALCGLGDVALAAGERGKATDLFQRALQEAIEIGDYGAERTVLSMAKLLAGKGARARAAELLAFALHAGWVLGWLPGGAALEQRLRAHVPPDEYAAAQERGRARDMGQTLRELLEELEGEQLT